LTASIAVVRPVACSTRSRSTANWIRRELDPRRAEQRDRVGRAAQAIGLQRPQVLVVLDGGHVAELAQMHLERCRRAEHDDQREEPRGKPAARHQNWK
jgi:hypothetical protein